MNAADSDNNRKHNRTLPFFKFLSPINKIKLQLSQRQIFSPKLECSSKPNRTEPANFRRVKRLRQNRAPPCCLSIVMQSPPHPKMPTSTFNWGQRWTGYQSLRPVEHQQRAITSIPLKDAADTSTFIVGHAQDKRTVIKQMSFITVVLWLADTRGPGGWVTPFKHPNRCPRVVKTFSTAIECDIWARIKIRMN